VLDGHGGKQAAEYSEKALAEVRSRPSASCARPAVPGADSSRAVVPGLGSTQHFSKSWNRGEVSVPDALDRAFTMTDKGLEQADIMFPGATCIVAFVHLEDKVGGGSCVRATAGAHAHGRRAA